MHKTISWKLILNGIFFFFIRYETDISALDAPKVTLNSVFLPIYPRKNELFSSQ